MPALLLISRRTNNLQAKRVGRLGDPLGEAIDKPLRHGSRQYRYHFVIAGWKTKKAESRAHENDNSQPIQ